MRRLHAAGSSLFLFAVAIACKKGEQASVIADASSAPVVSASAAASASSASTSASSYKVGDSVDVEWSGSWYESQVLAVLPGPQYKIHYVGWSSSYDETVGPARMRARSGGAATSAVASASASATTHANASDPVDHVSKCRSGDDYAGPPYNACLHDCLTEKDCSKACVGDFVVSSCSECVTGMSCIQVQHPMEDGVGWSKACVGKMAKGCSTAVTGGGCRAGWSKPTSQDECMQECANATNARETCPAGLVCTSARTWISPHCAKR